MCENWLNNSDRQLRDDAYAFQINGDIFHDVRQPSRGSQALPANLPAQDGPPGDHSWLAVCLASPGDVCAVRAHTARAHRQVLVL